MNRSEHKNSLKSAVVQKSFCNKVRGGGGGGHILRQPNSACKYNKVTTIY